MKQQVLVADIGGTNCRFQIWQYDVNAALPAEQAWSCLFKQRYASVNYARFDQLLEQVESASDITCFDAIVIGVAGPVQNQQVQFTNLHWSLSQAQLQARYPKALVALLNDFTIAAYALDGLTKEQYRPLYQPEKLIASGNKQRLLVGAGTGLGVALLDDCGANLSVVATEAGHVDFAPLNDFDAQLQAWLMQSWDHVSFERLVSGDGLVAIYQFLTQQACFDPTHGPTAATVAELAASDDKMAIQAIRLFWSYYGQFIGNMILCWPAFGGVFIAGGIAPKLLSWIESSAFFTRLYQKGRMRGIVASCPLNLILTDDLGLLGARNYASYQIQQALKQPTT
ncbi:glucokinase [Thiomicrospira sp. ALE5]|uniref:glucokinase n=1 Tax=Thiomicrospira sp. ALE5 TaxID=748650 RepID=UPI0008E7E232|nr:glucokinase [Thiomicrospira sp. ALE5]SFR60584.1 glucokinase [Thiomicrospira sp. ALE5]